MAQPAPAIELQQKLIAAFRQAWNEIEIEERSILEEPQAFRRRARLKELRAMITRSMNELDAEAARWFNDEFTRIYAMGGIDGSITSDFAWSQVHIDAVREIATNAMSDVLSATQHVRDDSKRFIREFGKSRITQMITQGQTPKPVARAVADVLRERGITAITYKDGSRHGLDEYTKMLVRTKSAEAYNVGTLTQTESEGVLYWEIIDGPDCGLTFHLDPTVASGLIVDKDTALAYPFSHPNCRRSFAPRPDIRTKKEAKEGKSLVTDQQRADVRAADQARQRRAMRGQSRQEKTRGRSRNPAFRDRQATKPPRSRGSGIL